MPILKTKAELELLEAANQLVHLVLDEVGASVRPGVSTAELDRLAETIIRDHQATPAFLGYHGYPATLCTSVNDVVVHGIPSDSTILSEGDIIGVDCGAFLHGYCGDSARTFAVGEISEEAVRLLECTRRALEAAVVAAQPGAHLSDVGHAVQTLVEAEGFSVVRDFVGHGIGTSMHEDPQVPNYGPAGRGLLMEPGLVLAIEPMVNTGRPKIKVDGDGWTARTRDGGLSAHFEYSVAVTVEGPRILGAGAENLIRSDLSVAAVAS